MDIYKFIAQIEEEFDEDIKPGTLKPDSKLEEGLELTSINALILISLIKVEYDIPVDAKQLSKCKTVQDLFNIVTKKT